MRFLLEAPETIVRNGVRGNFETRMPATCHELAQPRLLYCFEVVGLKPGAKKSRLRGQPKQHSPTSETRLAPPS